MNSITRFLRRIVINTRAEEYFVGLRAKSNLIRKFIPVRLRNKFPSIGMIIPKSADYPKNDFYSLTRDNTHFKINRSDYVQWRLFYGVRDNALLAAKKYLTPGSVILDIGANFGAFSLKLASYIKDHRYANIQIHAFEPNPKVYDNYKNNLALNSNLIDVIHLHPEGMGNEKSKRSFRYTDFNTGAGRVTKKDVEGQFLVEIKKLDDFANELNPVKIAFIKLIVEGFEPEVFKGGWKTIQKFRPPIFFEVTKEWWEENDSTIEDILDKLALMGYRFNIEHFNEMFQYEPARYALRTQFNLLAVVE
ncbi:MAG: FkbM family methyltransferase [Bacteroidia bacterium]|nr:FkbM family methyltransferase [Bacteroidia bacterium]